jgi:pyridinium-3,5-biscarboxylic acid mononucleotide synthase
MNKQTLEEILNAIQNHSLSVPDAVKRLSTLPYEDLGMAQLDHHRELRTGIPEVIWGDGKTTDQILTIMESMQKRGTNILATRISLEKASQIQNKFPEAQYSKDARLLSMAGSHKITIEKTKGSIAVLTAGTSDIPVAEEAALTAQFMGSEVKRINDVGIAGLHRLLDKLDEIRSASVIIVVAGMEGALPSAVAGLVDKPIIAVPTSVGYGTSLGGITALFAMLNSCAAGLTVVNIDNGFGAAVAAHMINKC